MKVARNKFFYTFDLFELSIKLLIFIKQYSDFMWGFFHLFNSNLVSKLISFDTPYYTELPPIFSKN